jgi:hypothetical protein
MASSKKFVLPPFAWMPLAVIAIFFIVNYFVSPVVGAKTCPGSQVYCPGVGCVSGQDKCFAGSMGGASKIFSKETFAMKSCPDNTRSDGPCLLEA